MKLLYIESATEKENLQKSLGSDYRCTICSKKKQINLVLLPFTFAWEFGCKNLKLWFD